MASGMIANSPLRGENGRLAGRPNSNIYVFELPDFTRRSVTSNSDAD